MKTIKKENFPSKICAVCNRPFKWRKKWTKVWDEVKYCSEKCRGTSQMVTQKAPLFKPI
ncbi:DUF2256 domain-containing protein [Pedobacter suwonensis]|uniref:DUF2256 domain-containing protein n=1 Tax=Pedobacter suwonensis TaxID=332999 RepID=UPI0036968F4E